MVYTESGRGNINSLGVYFRNKIRICCWNKYEVKKIK